MGLSKSLGFLFPHLPNEGGLVEVTVPLAII